MDADPLIRIRLRLSTLKELDLRVVSDRTGLGPGRTVIKGHAQAGSARRPAYRYSGWDLLLWSEQTVRLDLLLEGVVDALEPHALALREVIADLGLDAELGVHTFLTHECAARGEDAALSSTPDGTVSSRVIGFLASLPAGIDLDLYVTGDPAFGTAVGTAERALLGPLRK